ncbi:MAG: chitobiase/beta-hexosaminidase C-terminal domain-containing protein [Parasporobacterium sp.]|nr:chitobiase/beta-hexosaminidase C-terminal domain-containing protein [Parasporobacterium sp.]
MLCKECGADVNSSEVFCPNCGAPLRVTADYDYIQAEIGVKVDQFLNDEPAESEATDATASVSAVPKPEEDPAATMRISGDPELSIIGERPKKSAPAERKAPENKKENLENTIAVTRTLYVKDSIFGDEEAPDFEEEEEQEKEPRQENFNTEVLANRQAKRRKAQELAKKKRKRAITIAIIAAAVVVIGVLITIIAVSAGKKKPEEDADTGDVITCSVENGGTYQTPLEVTLWSDQDSRLVYTLDGTDPGIASGTKYAQPILFTNEDVPGDSTEITLKVVAFKKDASIKVGELTVTFTLSKSLLTAPYFDMESGDYYEPVYISIFADEGTTIYYTYDGSTPSENSTKYSGPIEMKRGNNILSAVAIDSSGTASEVSQAVYNLIIMSNISYDEAFGNVMVVLVEQGLIESPEADENGYYTVPGGGTRRIINGGEAVVDGTNYYVIQVDYMNDGSSVQATTYFGVDDQTGNVVRLNRSGMSFIMG